MTTRIFAAAMAIVLLTLPAYAQGMRSRNNSQATRASDADKDGPPRVDEKVYEKSLSNIQEKKYDPWRSVR